MSSSSYRNYGQRVDKRCVYNSWLNLHGQQSNVHFPSTMRRRHDTHHGDLFPSQSDSQPAIDPLETVLSSEGRIYCERHEWWSNKQLCFKQPVYNRGNKLRHSPFLWSLRRRLVFFFLASSCSSRDNSLSCSSPEQFMKSFHGYKNRTINKNSHYFIGCL